MSDQNPNGTPAPAAASIAVIDPREARALSIRDAMSNDGTPRAIVPRTFGEAEQFARAISTSSLIPEALRAKASDVLMIVLAGTELGIAPIRSLSMFHVMDGVPKLSSEALGAIVTASPVCEYLEPSELSNDRVTFRAKRRGRPEVALTYTNEDVERANLHRPSRSGAPSNHVKFPRAMKTARCRAELVRLVFPDIAAGIVTKEEAEDLAHLRDLEGPPPAAATFSAPPAPAPAPKAAEGKASTRATRSKEPTRAIDATATDSPTSTSSPPSSAPASSAGTSPPSSSGGVDTAAMDRRIAEDNAKHEAFAKAREGKAAIEAATSRAAADAAERPTTGPTPTGQDRGPEATGEDATTPATTDAVAPDAASPAPDAGADDFGEDEAPPPPAARTIEAFAALVADAVKRKDAARLEDVKREWLPWSKDESPTGGKAHAHKMRDLYARAKAELTGGR